MALPIHVRLQQQIENASGCVVSYNGVMIPTAYLQMLGFDVEDDNADEPPCLICKDEKRRPQTYGNFCSVWCREEWMKANGGGDTRTWEHGVLDRWGKLNGPLDDWRPEEFGPPYPASPDWKERELRDAGILRDENTNRISNEILQQFHS